MSCSQFPSNCNIWFGCVGGWIVQKFKREVGSWLVSFSLIAGKATLEDEGFRRTAMTPAAAATAPVSMARARLSGAGTKAMLFRRQATAAKTHTAARRAMVRTGKGRDKARGYVLLAAFKNSFGKSLNQTEMCGARGHRGKLKIAQAS